MKRIIIRVQWHKRYMMWVIKQVGEPDIQVYLRKGDAMYWAVQDARHIAKHGGKAQVVSHRKDGVIQWERTYPRISDPRRSRG